MCRIDMTVLAIPGFVGAMVAQHWWQRRHPAPPPARPGVVTTNSPTPSPAWPWAWARSSRPWSARSCSIRWRRPKVATAKTCNPLRIATHEWAAIISDIRGARTWRDRVAYLVRGPGWAPAARAW